MLPTQSSPRASLSIALTVAALMLAACAPAQDVRRSSRQNADAPGDAIATSSMGNTAAADDMLKGDTILIAERMTKGGVYANYKKEVVGNGEPAVLFFFDGSFPESVRTDGTLVKWYRGGEADGMLPVYKVEHAREVDLAKVYGVTQQNTIVKVDGSGKALRRVQGPTDPQLLGLLMQ